MKKVFLLLALACTIVACSDEKKSDKSGSDQTATNAKSASVYKIGDYYNENGKKGVVFEVSDGGNHGKIVSLDEAQLNWCTYDLYDRQIFIGASSKSDGKDNTYRVTDGPMNAWDQYPAFVFCRMKEGNDWYLPSKEELETIYNNRSKINQTLSAKNGEELKESYYWSSSEYDESWAWFVNMDGGYTNGAEKRMFYYVRAVATF